MYESFVVPMFVYGCESLITDHLKKQLESCEMKNISRKIDRVTTMDRVKQIERD